MDNFSDKEQLLLMAMRDTVKGRKIALPVIMFFELILITRWFIKNQDVLT